MPLSSSPLVGGEKRSSSRRNPSFLPLASGCEFRKERTEEEIDGRRREEEFRPRLTHPPKNGKRDGSASGVLKQLTRLIFEAVIAWEYTWSDLRMSSAANRNRKRDHQWIRYLAIAKLHFFSTVHLRVFTTFAGQKKTLLKKLTSLAYALV